MAVKLDTPLTPQQEAYCRAYIETGSQRQAYLSAYPKSQKWRSAIVDSRASDMMRLGKIKVRVSDLQAESRAEFSVTVANLTNLQMENRAFAMENAQAGAAVAAVQAIARMHGLDVERVKHEGDGISFSLNLGGTK